ASSTAASRVILARAWAAGVGRGPEPLTIDSTQRSSRSPARPGRARVSGTRSGAASGRSWGPGPAAGGGRKVGGARGRTRRVAAGGGGGGGARGREGRGGGGRGLRLLEQEDDRRAGAARRPLFERRQPARARAPGGRADSRAELAGARRLAARGPRRERRGLA